jgi:hypothetical protein
MGYTHTWRVTGNIPSATWQKICGDTRKLIAAFNLSDLCYAERYPTMPPRVSAETIQFNGSGNTGVEDFLLQRLSGRNFCKTEWCPYDRLVCAVLAVAAEHYWTFSIDSDGSWADWTPHIEWASAVLQRHVPNPLPDPKV